MSNYKRINWQTGMEITPQVLTDADNFLIEQQNIIRRLQVMPCYGLLPESVFNADIRIQSNTLLINDLEVKAITSQGQLIEINEQGKEYARVDLSPYQNYSQLYVTINATSCFELPCKDNILITADCYQGMPVAKIIHNYLDKNYIPPCISINSHQELLQKFNEIKQRISNILTEIKEQEKYKAILLPLSLLELDLNSHSEIITPLNLFLSIKKLVLNFKSGNFEILEKMEKLLKETYCHTEIYNMIALITDSLCELEEMAKAPIIEESNPQIRRIKIATN